MTEDACTILILHRGTVTKLSQIVASNVDQHSGRVNVSAVLQELLDAALMKRALHQAKD